MSHASAGGRCITLWPCVRAAGIASIVGLLEEAVPDGGVTLGPAAIDRAIPVSAGDIPGNVSGGLTTIGAGASRGPAKRPCIRRRKSDQIQGHHGKC